MSIHGVHTRLAKAAAPATAAALIHELADVDVQYLSIVGKGANRKRFFLRRSGDEPATEALIDLPAPSALIVKGGADPWSAVYCVVAEPGWLEDAGLYGDQAAADRWASEDEIRKACHRFAKNGGRINRMHESIEPYGTLVENALAHADFTVTDADGEAHVIRKGSWYVAIEPNDDGRAAIEAGEFTGVSIEGTGVRTPVGKAQTRRRANVGKVKREGNGDGVVKRALAKLLGEDAFAALEADELAKSRPTFAERMAARDFEDELPAAFDVFRDSIWAAFYPCGDDESASPKELAGQSIDEFHAWLDDLLDSQPLAKIASSIEKAGGQTPLSATVENVLTDEQKAQLEKAADLADKIDALPAAIAKAIKDGAEAEADEANKADEPTLASVAEQVGELAKSVKGIDDRVTAFGAGAQAGNGNGAGNPATVAKSAAGKAHEGIL